ncbi:MAG TPA: glycosyltransferase, partial [Gaiellaceae bacterium]
MLLISYYFPPIGGAGAQRPVKLARHLLDLGYSAVVVTGPGQTGGMWTPPDPSLSLEIPPEVEVIRVPGPEPASRGGIRTRIDRFARIETEWTSWWRNGVLAAAAAARLEGIDAIYTIMSPFASAEPSLALARAHGIGWIADLGDPWALDEMMVYPTGVHRRLELARMRRLLGSAAAVVMSTPEAARQVV